MVTGDHPITAQAIAKGVGIIGPSKRALLSDHNTINIVLQIV